MMQALLLLCWLLDPVATNALRRAPAPKVAIVTVETRKGASFLMPGVPGASPWSYRNVGAGATWHGMRTKTALLAEWLDEAAAQDPERLVVLADGGDILSGGCSEDELLAKYHALLNASGTGASVVAGAEVMLWPPFFHGVLPYCAVIEKQRRDVMRGLLHLEPDAYTPVALASGAPRVAFCSPGLKYQFANAGFLMGPVHALQELLHGGMLAARDEQVGLAKFLTEHPGKVVLDYGGTIVLNSLRWLGGALRVEDGVVRNIVTRSTQCFLHANGFYYKASIAREGGWAALTARLGVANISSPSSAGVTQPAALL